MTRNRAIIRIADLDVVKILGLPENFEVVGVTWSPETWSIDVVVQSPSLRGVDERCMLPTVKAEVVYNRVNVAVHIPRRELMEEPCV